MPFKRSPMPHPVPHATHDGWSFELPAGWRVSAHRPGALEICDLQGTAAAMVRRHQVLAHSDLSQWLCREFTAGDPGLHNVRMLSVSQLGAQVARVSFDYGSQVFQGHASVVAVRHHALATLYIAAAARAVFAQRLPELTRILGSLRWGCDAGTVEPSRLTSPSGLTRLLMEVPDTASLRR